MLWANSTFIFLLLSLSCVSCATAVWCCIHLRRLLRGASTRSLTRLSLEMTELQSQCESLIDAHRRLTSRVGMQALRARRKEEPPAEEPVSNGADREKLRELARSRGLMR